MNQEPIAKELHRRQAIRWIGCSDTVETADLAKSIGEFLSNSGEIEQRSTICKAIVDGNGLERTLEILMMNPDTKLFPRLVTVDDEALTMDSILEKSILKRIGLGSIVVLEIGIVAFFSLFVQTRDSRLDK
jgi:hypothetical protein